MPKINRAWLAGAAASIALIASPAVAGTYAKGFGKTITEATDNATKNAQAAVDSRGVGCIGVGKDGNPDDGVLVDRDKKTRLWIVKVFYSFHAGSCGQMSRDKRLGIAVAKAYLMQK